MPPDVTLFYLSSLNVPRCHPMLSDVTLYHRCYPMLLDVTRCHVLVSFNVTFNDDSSYTTYCVFAREHIYGFYCYSFFFNLSILQMYKIWQCWLSINEWKKKIYKHDVFVFFSQRLWLIAMSEWRHVQCDVRRLVVRVHAGIQRRHMCRYPAVRWHKWRYL